MVWTRNSELTLFGLICMFLEIFNVIVVCVYALLQNEGDSLQKKNRKATIITVTSVGFVIIGIVLLMVGCTCLAYRKHQQ